MDITGQFNRFIFIHRYVSAKATSPRRFAILPAHGTTPYLYLAHSQPAAQARALPTHRPQDSLLAGPLAFHQTFAKWEGV